MQYGQINVLGKTIYYYTEALYINFYLMAMAGHNILFDCGEGTATLLKEKILRVDNVFITHHHTDHFGGLTGFILLRNIIRGGTDRPLCVFYPNNNNFIKSWIDYFQSLNLTLQYQLKFLGLEQYSEVFLNKNAFISGYPVKHDNECFSYMLFEKTVKLKKEYLSLKDITLRKNDPLHKDLFKNDIKCRFFYSGDACCLNGNTPDKIDIGIFDSTFIRSADRGFDSHLAMEELLCYIKRRKVRVLLLTHISQRYNIKEIRRFFADLKINCESAYFLYNNKYESINTNHRI